MARTTINLSNAATLIATIGGTNTILLRGQPGVGKSSILKTLAQRMPDFHAAYIDCTNLDLGDLAMPVIDKEEMTTSYAPNTRFGVSRSQTKPVLLMLDELGKASRPVMNMLLPTILEHRIGDRPLLTGSIVFATTNLDTDGVGDNIPAHAYNRLSVLTVANPTVDEWVEWGMANEVAPEVLVFVKQFPQVMDCYADLEAGDKNPYIFNPTSGNIRAFCSPRSLEKASNVIKSRAALGDALLPALIGTVGEAAARDLEAMVHLGDTLPTWGAIVADPSTARLPLDVAAMFMTAFMVAGRVESGTMDTAMQYMNRIKGVSVEAWALFLTSIAKNSKKLVFAVRNREFTKAAAEIGRLL